MAEIEIPPTLHSKIRPNTVRIAPRGALASAVISSALEQPAHIIDPVPPPMTPARIPPPAQQPPVWPPYPTQETMAEMMKKAAEQYKAKHERPGLLARATDTIKTIPFVPAVIVAGGAGYPTGLVLHGEPTQAAKIAAVEAAVGAALLAARKTREIIARHRAQRPERPIQTTTPDVRAQQEEFPPEFSQRFFTSDRVGKPQTTTEGAEAPPPPPEANPVTPATDQQQTDKPPGRLTRILTGGARIAGRATLRILNTIQKNN